VGIKRIVVRRIHECRLIQNMKLGMIKAKYLEKSCLTTNSTWPNLVLNLGSDVGKAQTNRLSYGMVVIINISSSSTATIISTPSLTQESTEKNYVRSEVWEESLTMYSQSCWITLPHAHHVLGNTLVFPLISWPHVSYHEIATIHYTHSAITQNWQLMRLFRRKGKAWSFFL
jgi:hypothetical protein